MQHVAQQPTATNPPSSSSFSSSLPWQAETATPAADDHGSSNSSSSLELSSSAYPDASDENEGEDLSTPPYRPSRHAPAMSYFQAYTPLASSSTFYNLGAQASAGLTPTGNGVRRMSKVKSASSGDLRGASKEPASSSNKKRGNGPPQAASSRTSSKDGGRPSIAGSSRPSFSRSGSSSSSKDAVSIPSSIRRTSDRSRQTVTPPSAQPHSSNVRARTPSAAPSPGRITRSATLSSHDDLRTSPTGSPPRSTVKFGDSPPPSAARAAKLATSRRRATQTPTSSTGAPPSTSEDKRSRARSYSTRGAPSSSALHVGRQAAHSQFELLPGEGQGPPELSAATQATNAVERRIYFESHEREKERMRKQEEFVRERQRTLLQELETTEALPGLLKGEKPPKSKKELEGEERKRREKRDASKRIDRSNASRPSGSSSFKSPSPLTPPTHSSSSRTPPASSLSCPTPLTFKPSGSGSSTMAFPRSLLDERSAPSPSSPPPSEREQLNIRTIDEIIKSGLARESLLHTPNLRPLRSAFAPSPSTAQFPASKAAVFGGTRVERSASESSVGDMDSGTEEASKTVFLRDGKPMSWGWDRVRAAPDVDEHGRKAARPAAAASRAAKILAQPSSKHPSVSHKDAPRADPHDLTENGSLPPTPDHQSSISSIYTASSTSTVSTVQPSPHVPLSRRSSTSSTGFKAASSLSPKYPNLDHALLLQSPKLTRLFTLGRQPYKNLTVSLSDVGSPTGHPVVVYLGLGGVRYLTALFDDLAQSMNLRLICIDRFGLGKSDDVPAEKRGFLQWASVVEEVADQLGLDRFSVLAHSAGSPFAMATCLRLPERVYGSVNLLAPWVGLEVDGGYKWLRYVPTSVIRTAQAAEWKMQGWMLGKPPAPISNAAKGSMSFSTAHTNSPSATTPVSSSFAAPEIDGIPEEALAYIDLHDRNSPTESSSSSPAAAETTEYPVPGRAGSPSAETAGLPRGTPTNGGWVKSPAISAAMPGRVDLGTALLRACHAENQGGTADLLAIMKRSSEWGFAYTDVKLPVKVWYGDRDEKINEKSVRWLERELDDCMLVIKKGEGHNLLSSTRVIVEVLESIAGEVAAAGCAR